MSDKIEIKSLNGHPLADTTAREKIAALEAGGGSGGSGDSDGVAFLDGVYDSDYTYIVGMTFDEAKSLLLSGKAIHVYLRYAYDGEEALDILIRPVIQLNYMCLKATGVECIKIMFIDDTDSYAADKVYWLSDNSVSWDIPFEA